MAWNDFNKGQQQKYRGAWKQLYGNEVANPPLQDGVLLAVNNKPKRLPRGCLTEDAEHVKCADWLRSKNIYFHHSPNGEKRSLHVGAKLKRMGVKPGWPDFELPFPTPHYHGLFVELKALDGHLNRLQREVLAELNSRGYKAVCAYGFDEFKQIVEEYFKF